MALRKRSRATASHSPILRNQDPNPSPRQKDNSNVILQFWPHLLALLDLLLAYIASLRIRFLHISMGLTDWWSSRTGSEEDDDGEERLAMIERSPRRSTAAVNGDGKQVKRRRYKPNGTGETIAAEEEAVHFPGMVNLSGTLCYMNSVLQAFASVTSLFTQLENIVKLAVDVDLPTPVTDALLEVLYDLNTPQKRQPPALRPVALLHALQTLPAIRRLLSTREQQDAHELFLVLAEAVSDEALKVAAEVAASRGLGEILSLQGYHAHKDQQGQETRAKKRGLQMPWEGLMARRRVCRTCGWCESIRMDTLGGMELAIPLNGDVTVEQCISQYLAPEALSDVTCEMCSLRATLQFYSYETTRLSSPASTVTNGHSHPSTQQHTKSGSFSALEHAMPNTNGIESASPTLSANRKRKAQEAKKVHARLQAMLDSGTVSHFGESILPADPHRGVGSLPIKWQTARTDSIREAAITRPPQSLRLHFIRSEYTPYGQLLKKSARVAFPMILDLTQFVSDGVWEERNVMAMLGAGAGAGAEAKASEAAVKPQTRVLYRLESVILHYGYTHSSGHYICIRRKPRPSDDECFRPVPARKSCPDQCACESCRWFGQVRPTTKDTAGRGWMRISDADVDEVGPEALTDARAAVFMVFYEKVAEAEAEPKAGELGQKQA